MAYKRKPKNGASPKIGRPIMLTDEIQEKVCQAIRAGNYNVVAAQYAGISQSTFCEWVAKGEDGIEPFVKFSEAVKKAESDCEVAAVANVRKHWEKNWIAAMTWLERKHRVRWGRSIDTVQITTDKSNEPTFVLNLKGSTENQQ
jgi:hypothetical protein